LEVRRQRVLLQGRLVEVRRRAREAEAERQQQMADLKEAKKLAKHLRKRDKMLRKKKNAWDRLAVGAHSGGGAKLKVKLGGQGVFGAAEGDETSDVHKMAVKIFKAQKKKRRARKREKKRLKKLAKKARRLARLTKGLGGGGKKTPSGMALAAVEALMGPGPKGGGGGGGDGDGVGDTPPALTWPGSAGKSKLKAKKKAGKSAAPGTPLGPIGFAPAPFFPDVESPAKGGGSGGGGSTPWQKVVGGGGGGGGGGSNAAAAPRTPPVSTGGIAALLKKSRSGSKALF